MDDRRQVLQRFGVALGILWTGIVGVCSLALIALFAANYEASRALLAGAIIIMVGVVLVVTAWFIVRLWMWIFE